MARERFPVRRVELCARTAGSAAPPSHARIAPLAAGLLIAALLTDLFYVRTVSTQWETFSIWLITAGLLTALIAAIAFVADLVRRRDLEVSPLKFTLFISAAVVGVVNALVHSRDGYTAVAPTGVILSAVTAAILLIASRPDWSATRLARVRRR